MFEIEKTERINQLIACTKSDSGIAGPKLARAHMELGELLGARMQGFSPEDTTVVAILRGGIFFAQGIYFQMGCRFQTFDPKHEKFVRPKTKHVILTDSVIHTGKTLLPILEEDMAVACCGSCFRKAAVYHTGFGEFLCGKRGVQAVRSRWAGHHHAIISPLINFDKSCGMWYD